MSNPEASRAMEARILTIIVEQTLAEIQQYGRWHDIKNSIYATVCSRLKARKDDIADISALAQELAESGMDAIQSRLAVPDVLEARRRESERIARESMARAEEEITILKRAFMLDAQAKIAQERAQVLATVATGR